MVLFETRGAARALRWATSARSCAAAVMASYVMYGFDTAGTLAEETDDPRRRAPRAILQASLAAVGWPAAC